VFQDEHGDYPAGSYVRNPPTTRHTPGSEPGCVIFVKLWQFDPADRTGVRIESGKGAFQPASGRPGVEIMPLFKDAHEEVRLERWAPEARIELALPQGAEFLVLSGGFEERSERFAEQSWLRLPANATLRAKAGTDGCRVWVKSGHLANVATFRPQPAA
jgi:hypothetical protein